MCVCVRMCAYVRDLMREWVEVGVGTGVGWVCRLAVWISYAHFHNEYLCIIVWGFFGWKMLTGCG